MAIKKFARLAWILILLLLCLAPAAMASIGPKAQVPETSFDFPYSVLRQFTKKTKVFFNDPDHPQVLLTLQGYGKPFIEIQPSHIIRFRGQPGEKLRSQVRFTSHLPGNFAITDFKINIPQDIDVTVKAEEPGRIYVVEVSNKRQESGNYAGVIELSTTSPKRPRLIMRVFGELSLPMIHFQVDNNDQGIVTLIQRLRFAQDDTSLWRQVLK